MSEFFFYEKSNLINSTFLATYRLLWAVTMSWVIFAFHNGSLAWISWIFNHKVWIPLGKLTLSMYLIHPIVIASRISSNKQPIDFEILQLVRDLVSNLLFRVNENLMIIGVLFLFSDRRCSTMSAMLLSHCRLHYSYTCASRRLSVSFRSFS